MDNFETIQVFIDKDGFVILTLNRPKFKNAFNQKMIEEFKEVLNNIKSSKELRALIIRAKGDIFCAGGDLKWMKETLSKENTKSHADKSPTPPP